LGRIILFLTADLLDLLFLTADSGDSKCTKIN